MLYTEHKNFSITADIDIPVRPTTVVTINFQIK